MVVYGLDEIRGDASGERWRRGVSDAGRHHEQKAPYCDGVNETRGVKRVNHARSKSRCRRWRPAGSFPTVAPRWSARARDLCGRAGRAPDGHAAEPRRSKAHRALAGRVPCASVRMIVIARLRLPSPARLLPALGFVLASSLAPSPASGLDLPSLRSDQPPVFNADVAVSVDSNGTPGLSITVSLAYPELQWLRVPDGFAARFEVIAVFEPARAVAQYGDTWQRQIRVSSFDQTTSYTATVMERRTFRLPPGRYRL